MDDWLEDPEWEWKDTDDEIQFHLVGKGDPSAQPEPAPQQDLEVSRNQVVPAQEYLTHDIADERSCQTVGMITRRPSLR